MANLANYYFSPDPEDEDPYVPPPERVVTVEHQPSTAEPSPKARSGDKGIGNSSAMSLSFPDYDFGVVPAFDAPEFFAPTAESVLSSPDYQSRLKSGTDALEHSAAARGVLRTGGTLKDIIDYGKKFGQGEYDSSFNHALQSYQANYQRLHDIFAPKLAGWQANAQASLAKALAIYGRYTSWNAPRTGGGGYTPIPTFQPNPYGDPTVTPTPSVTPTVPPEKERKRRSLTSGYEGYSFA